MNAMVKCEFCGKVGRRRKFMGRFCTKVCIARNAVEARKTKSSFVKQKVGKIKRRGRIKSLKQKSTSASVSSRLKRKIAFAETKPKQFKVEGILAKHPLRKRNFSEIMSEIILDLDTFTWETYLAEQNAVGLDCKQFELITGRSGYPTKQNTFKEGQLLEVVDPFHQSLFCVASVVQVEGLRMRLHFLGYYDCYDFWTDADSPFVFPRGFCKKTNRQLCGPDNYVKADVDPDFDSSFSPSTYANATQFKIGDKLEAFDRKHHSLICVATIADIIGEHILIHFDGWEKDFDYWALSSSPYIHPVGWCNANNKPLSPPPNHDPSSPFVWSEYLKSSDSFAADASCFQPLSKKFETGMKIEALDQRNTLLIRVATIIEVNDLQIKTHYDGWSSLYDDWFDVDSRDIHPINWCYHAGYPLHPPVDDSKLFKKSCPVKGCPSLGHLNSPKYFAYHKKHYSEHGCPYSIKNMTKKDGVSDRFAVPSLKASGTVKKRILGVGAIHKSVGNRQGFRLKPGRKRSSSQTSPFKDKKEETESLHQSYQHPKRYNTSRHRKPTRDDVLTGEPGKNGASSKSKDRSMHDLAIRSSVISSLASLSSMHLPHCWDKNVRHLPGVNGVKSSDVMKWDIGKVAAFVTTLTGKLDCGNAFEREEVDGEALLLLSQNDILNTLKLKLGPAVKIYNAILFFKVLEKDYTS